jgi:hypothetical protein
MGRVASLWATAVSDAIMVMVLETRFLAWWQTSRHIVDGIHLPGIIDPLPVTTGREVSVDTVPVAVGNSNETGTGQAKKSCLAVMSCCT